MDNNFVLTESAFRQMAENVQAGDNTGFEQVFLLHFEDCMNFVKRKYQASHTDAYDASMDALLYFHERLYAGKVYYGNLRFLFTQMACQHYLRRRKKAANHVVLTEKEDWPEELPSIPEEDQETLHRAWKRMGEQCRELLQQLFYENRSAQELSSESGQKPAAIRKRKQRCMTKLRTIFMQLSK